MGRMNRTIRRSITCHSELGWAKMSPAAGFLIFAEYGEHSECAACSGSSGCEWGNWPGRTAAMTGLLACWACYCVGLIPLGGSPFTLEYQGGRVGLHFPIAAIFFWSWIHDHGAGLARPC